MWRFRFRVTGKEAYMEGTKSLTRLPLVDLLLEPAWLEGLGGLVAANRLPFRSLSNGHETASQV